MAGKLIAAIGCAALVQFSEPSQALTIRDAVQAAIQTNPDVGIVIESRRAVQQEVEQAKGVLYPQLDARIAYGHEWVTDPATRARARDNTRDLDVTSLPRSEVGITINQLLFDGFAAIREIDRQKARVRSSTRRVCETSELIGLDAIEAYLEALRQRELVALARLNVGIHENHLKLTRSKVAGGASSQADVEQADSRLASARDNLAEAEGRMIDADTTYKRIVGDEPKELQRPQTPVNQLPQTLDSVVGLATDMNPTVRVLRADVETAEEALRGADAPFYPRFDLQLATNRTDNVGGTRGADIDGSALVVMTYNIFRGGRDLARKHELVARMAESRQRLNRQLRLAEQESQLSWNALENARLRLRAIRAEVQANDRVRNTYRQQFDIGQRSLLDLLDSENELFVARTNQITSEFVEYFGIYRILSAAGLLLSTLDVAPAAEGCITSAMAAPLIQENPVQPMQQLQAPERNIYSPQKLLPSDEPITPTYVPPQQRMAPYGQPSCCRSAPSVLRKPSAKPSQGVGAPVLDPNAPMLDPNAPIPPGSPAAVPGQSNRAASFRNAARPSQYRGQPQYRRQPYGNAKYNTQQPTNSSSAPPTTQHVGSQYQRSQRSVEQSQNDPVIRNAPLQLTARQKSVDPARLADGSPQMQRVPTARASYWEF